MANASCPHCGKQVQIKVEKRIEVAAHLKSVSPKSVQANPPCDVKYLFWSEM